MNKLAKIFFLFFNAITVRYFLAGGIVISLDFGLLNILYLLGVNLIIATTVGFIAGSVMGFFIHSRWTFNYDTSGKNMLKLSQFLGVGIGGLVLTDIIIYSLAYKIGLNYNTAKVIAVLVSIIWAYSASRWWVFRKKCINKESEI